MQFYGHNYTLISKVYEMVCKLEFKIAQEIKFKAVSIRNYTMK